MKPLAWCKRGKLLGLVAANVTDSILIYVSLQDDLLYYIDPNYTVI